MDVPEKLNETVRKVKDVVVLGITLQRIRVRQRASGAGQDPAARLGAARDEGERDPFPDRAHYVTTGGQTAKALTGTIQVSRYKQRVIWLYNFGCTNLGFTSFGCTTANG